MENLKTPAELLNHVVTKFAEHIGWRFQELDPEILESKELMTCAVSANAQTFAYASDELRDDYELAKIAVGADGTMLSKVSERLLSNRELIAAAVKQNPFSLRFSDNRLWADDELLNLAFGDYKKPSSDDSEKLEEFVDKLMDYHGIHNMEQGQEKEIGSNSVYAYCLCIKESGGDSKQMFFSIKFQAEPINLLLNLVNEEGTWGAGACYFRDEDEDEDFGENGRIDELMGDLDPSSMSDDIVIRFYLNKGEGEWPAVNELSGKEEIDLRNIAKFTFCWDRDEHNLEDVEIEQIEVLYDGVRYSNMLECGLSIIDGNVTGFPTPIFRFKLSEPVSTDAFLKSIWTSVMSLKPVARDDDESDPFYCEDHNGYSSVIENDNLGNTIAMLKEDGLYCAKIISIADLEDGLNIASLIDAD